MGVMEARERRAVGVIALIAICRMFGLFAAWPELKPKADEAGDAALEKTPAEAAG